MNLKWKCGQIVLAVIVGMVVSLAPAHAQTSNGTIVGSVTDPAGAAVLGAAVTVTNTDLGAFKRTTKTDSAGSYRIDGLLPGSYSVSIQASGMQEFVEVGVAVKASLASTVNASLVIGTVNESVSVEASTGAELQTQSGELSSNLGQTELKNLPIFGLNPIELAFTVAGVQEQANRDAVTNGVGFSVNGTRPRANNFLIDGQDNNDNSIQGQAFLQTNEEAVREVTVLTNSYSAEFGRGGGAVTNVIYKSGTNDFHGSAWELNRNSALAAVPAQSGFAGITKNPFDNENTFGFTFGGPIKKNKLFVFGTSQWDRERASAAAQTNTLLVPTDAGIATLQSLGPNPRVDFLIASLGGLRGGTTGVTTFALGNDPNGNPRPAVQVADVQRSQGSIATNDRQWSVKLDYIASPTDTLTVRFFRDDINTAPDFFNQPSALPGLDSQVGGPSFNFGFTWQHTLSSHAVNELRFSYGQFDIEFGPTPQTAANPIFNSPAIVITDLLGPTGQTPSFGFLTGFPQGRGHKTYQFQDALSYTVGRHTFKVGADVALLTVRDISPIDNRGEIFVRPGGGFTGLANFIDDFTGNGGSIDKVFGSPVTLPFLATYAPYVQDTWHLRQNLSVDLGLRYEYQNTFENSLPFPSLDTKLGVGLRGTTNFPGVFASQQQGDKNNFAPRVGLAYTPHFWSRFLGHDKTVIRAGYGIFYDQLFTNILDNTATSSPNAVQDTVNAGGGRGVANASAVLAGFSSVPSPTGSVSTIASNLRNPLTHQWNLDIQRELPGNFILTAAYVGTRGERLFVNQDFNPGNGQFDANGNVIRMNPNLGSILVRTNGGDSIYHAGQLTLDRKFSHGLLLRGAYTYSKFIDDTSEVFITSGLSSFAQNVFNQGADRGLSAYDRRHRMVLTYVWDVPFVRGSSNRFSSALKAVTRDWQTSGIFTWSTGAPETFNDGFDANGDGHGGNDRPNLGNPAAPLTAVGIDGTQLGLTTTPGTFFGPNAHDCINGAPTCVAGPASSFHFLIPASGLGNVGRNTFISPGFQNYNLTVQRSFKIPLHDLQRQQILVRGEFLNAFNHPNLGIPSLNLSGGNVLNEAGTINGGREIRVLLRYSF
ncbi:MAG TPA: carboxypeptidase regulatory-like domain-containing protein [Candidatus Udaeobacter sp.]|nr:carboxypeptidase regulatory-like domain-containing protein [Candidatus Udaeobacter sp.]